MHLEQWTPVGSWAALTRLVGACPKIKSFDVLAKERRV
jgi:hypothetical protein